MTVQELIERLEAMPMSCHVYLQTAEGQPAPLLVSAEYNDTLGAPDGEDDADGVLLSGFILLLSRFIPEV